MKRQHIAMCLAALMLLSAGFSACGRREVTETSAADVTIVTGSASVFGSEESTQKQDDTEKSEEGTDQTTPETEEYVNVTASISDDDMKQILELEETMTYEETQAPTVSHVGLGSNTVIVDDGDTEEVELSIDSEYVMQLENMNVFVPLFTSGTAHDEEFQKEVLRYGFMEMRNGGSLATVQDAAGHELEVYKVSEEEAVHYYETVIGDVLTIRPEKPADFGDGVPVYFEDGNFYIGKQAGAGFGYMYHRAYQRGDQIYVAFMRYDDDNTYDDSIFEIKWADNENGFIVTAHYYQEA